ncbi:BACON domain-containing protein [Alistipes ihumii]|uniref:BACON domain-containing protein n=1 Tax=Alistipes ihumii TaxID=1470347 RepID=UPI003AB14AF9
MRPGCRGAIPACYIESRSGGVSRITPTSIGVSCGYDRCTVNIQSNIRWSVTSSVSWIFPLTMGGTGDGTTELSIMENFEQQRSGVVTISGTTSSGEEIVRRIDVTQAWCKRRTTRVYIGKKGDRLIACSGAWPATSRLTVDFYFTYYMKRYEYALHIEKGSFWTEDSVGIPWVFRGVMRFRTSRSSSLSCRITMKALFLRSGKIGVPSKTDGSEVRPGRTKQSAGLPMLADRRSEF